MKVLFFMFKQICLVAIGGALGACLRYFLMSLLSNQLSPSLSLLLVNGLGCFFLPFFQLPIFSSFSPILIIGLVSSFTTMSLFIFQLTSFSWNSLEFFVTFLGHISFLLLVFFLSKLIIKCIF